MRRNMIAHLTVAAALLLALPGSLRSAGAAYPEKPIELFVVFAPGGSMDSSARALSSAAEPLLGQPLVIVTKDGGGGTVGLGLLANEKPNGYTLAAATSTGIIRVPLRRSVPYKPLASFTNIFAYAAVATSTVVRPDAPYKTFKELVEYARAHPGQVKYSTAGAGTPMHLAMALVAKQEGIKWTHIPFDGSAPAETALLGGHVDFCSTGDMDKALTGQLRPLVVHTKDRMKQLPDVPTLMELGYNYFNDTVFAIYGPAGMDPATVKTLEEAFAKAVDSERFQNLCDKFALVPLKMGSAEYTKMLEDGWAPQEELLKELGLIEKAATQPR